LIRTWKADYNRNQPALHSRYPTLTDFANDKLVQHLNANGTGSRGRTASEQIFAQAYTLRAESMEQTSTLRAESTAQSTPSVRGPKEELNGATGDQPPAEGMGGFCGPNGHMATVHYCCVDDNCEFCDCWGAFTNCCVFGPLELRRIAD
jgi:hypothetical protein